MRTYYFSAFQSERLKSGIDAVIALTEDAVAISHINAVSGDAVLADVDMADMDNAAAAADATTGAVLCARCVGRKIMCSKSVMPPIRSI